MAVASRIAIALSVATPVVVRAQPAEAPPLPAGSTRATFVSTTDVPWDVVIDRQLACTTPCAIVVVPQQYVSLRAHAMRPNRLDVGYLPGGDVTYRAEPVRRGRYAGAIVGTTFASFALAAGISLTAVGCTTHDRAMCAGGVITGVAGGGGLYASIALLRSALPRLHVGPARPYATVGQLGVAGAF